MLNLQLKLGAFGQNAQGFEKDYKGQPEPPARGQGSVLPEIKNYGAGGEYVSNNQRLEGTNKEGLGISRLEFIRNQQRIEYPSVLFPQAPIAYAKEQIKEIAKILMKDYSYIRNAYLPNSVKQEMINQSLLKVRGFPARLVKIADEMVEERISSYGEDEEINPDDYDFIDELEEYLQEQEAQTRGVIAPMRGEGGDLEDIVAGENEVPLRMAGLVPQAMDALGTHRGRPIRPERETFQQLLMRTPSEIDIETVSRLTAKERTNLRKAYGQKGIDVPSALKRMRAPTRGALPAQALPAQALPEGEEVSRAMEARAGGLTEEQQQLLRQMRE